MSQEYNNDIDGWMSVEELNWLYNTAKNMDSIVEIGCWKGRSTHALCSGCKGKVYAVDHFKGSTGEEEAHKEAQEKDIRKEFEKNMEGFNNLTLLPISSKEAMEKFKDKEVDMVFIDGSHDYESVKEDIEGWLPKCKKLISGHDFSVDWEGVQRAVKEKFGDQIDVVDTIWIVDLEKYEKKQN